MRAINVFNNENLFIGLEETNIRFFRSSCCGAPLSLELLCRVVCGACGENMDFGETPHIINTGTTINRRKNDTTV